MKTAKKTRRQPLDPRSAPLGDHRDSEVPALHLRVGVHARTWHVQMRRPGGRAERRVLGTWPAMPIEKAREAALLHRAAIHGEIPAPVADAGPTLEQGITRYLKSAAFCKLRPATQLGYRRTLQPKGTDWLAAIRKLPLRLLTSVHLRDLRDATPNGARDKLKKLQAFFAWAADPTEGALLAAELRFPELPAGRIDTRSLVRFPESGPDLSELGAIARGIRRFAGEQPRWAALYRFAMLCPTRPEETNRLRWQDVEALDTEYPVLRVWMAKRESYTVPLSAAAAEVLRALPWEGEYIFGGAAPLPDHAGPSVRRRLYALANEEAGRELAPWSLKHLRKAPRSWLSEQRVPAEIARRLLGHADPYGGRIDAHYDGALHLRRLRELAEQWANAVAEAELPPRPALTVVRRVA